MPQTCRYEQLRRRGAGSTGTALLLLSVALLACAPASEEGAAESYTSVPQVGGAGTGQDGDLATTNPAIQGGNQPVSDANLPLVPIPTITDPNAVAANTASPNVAATPNVTTSAIATLGTNASAQYGIGFALAAIDYPGYCLESVDAAMAAGSALHLAPCVNSVPQAWGWYRGGFALNKKVCITGAASNGSPALLRACQGLPTQIWQLAPDSRTINRTLPSTTTVQGLTIVAVNYKTAQVLGGLPSTAENLRLAIRPLPATDGIRIHTFANRVDLCLTDVAGVPKLIGCGEKMGGQVWTVVGDQLRSMLGRCLLGDVTSRAVTLGTCADAPPPTAQWYMMNNFVSLLTPSAVPAASSLVLDVDTTNNVPKLNLTSGLTPLYSVGAPAFF